MPSGTPLDKGEGFSPLEMTPQNQAFVQRNLMNSFAQASPRARQMGSQFYPRAHEEVVAPLARRLNAPLANAAGFVAALSPQADWYADNIPAAHALANASASDIESLRAGDRSVLSANQFKSLRKQTSDNIKKAISIGFDHEDPETTLSPLKTGDFSKALLNPADNAPYTFDTIMHDEGVDRHMAWSVNRGLGAKGRYGMLRDSGRGAAFAAGVNPSEHQPTVWFAGKEKRGTDLGSLGQ